MAPLFTLIRETSFLAQDDLNKWLDDNPIVLGLGAMALGGVLLGFGLKDIVTQRATGKWGVQHTGGMAVFTGVIRAVAGGVLICFGLYKAVAG